MSRDGAFEVDPSDTVLMCSFRAGTGVFGIDTTRIREVLGATVSCPVPLAPEYIDGVVQYRGEVLTTVSLRVLLGLERIVGANSVIVLGDEVTDERFGLVVDGVGGVVAMARSAVEANPSTLGARSLALFDGICKTNSGWMVRLDPKRLRPSRLAESELFETVGSDRSGAQR